LGPRLFRAADLRRRYVMVEASNLKLNDSSPMVPWLAKTDSSDSLLWQHFYYQV
jgi:hypothetical protein